MILQILENRKFSNIKITVCNFSEFIIIYKFCYRPYTSYLQMETQQNLCTVD